MMNEYSDNLLKYVNDPSHVGFIEQPDGIGETGLDGGNVGNRLAVRFTLQVHRERIQKVRFQVFGCGYTIAACAAAAELCEGRKLQDIAGVTSAAINQRLNYSLPAERSYCAELASEALHAAVASARDAARPVAVQLVPEQPDGSPRVQKTDPLYKALLAASVPALSQPEIEDRQMFACLLTVASQDSWPLHPALGLDERATERILATFFPSFDKTLLERYRGNKFPPLPDINADVQTLLQGYLDTEASVQERQAGELLVRILAARASYPGHLWVAMGFFQRSQLSAAIQRHLPRLAAANHNNMRWKRFFFKQVCELNGGILCKNPNCGDCSDYSLCFVDEEEPVLQ
ncbi:nitrogen fixation protein NifQ [Pelobacter seleniigenes]|uniref:nitrogen fixation protein NifQ n=1 Tax=Pelobacter seleniigenes TaxID=407188 RepID=UPI00068A597D|nr:nitrogen fixation protein NifQ [Pelobacter seleniigenes]